VDEAAEPRGGRRDHPALLAVQHHQRRRVHHRADLGNRRRHPGHRLEAAGTDGARHDAADATEHAAAIELRTRSIEGRRDDPRRSQPNGGRQVRGEAKTRYRF